MELPPLGPGKFLILSTLQDGREKTPADIMRECAWTKSRPYFLNRLRSLHEDGLVDRFKVRRQRNGRWTSMRSVARINAAGRRTWQEVLDWYLFVAKSVDQAGGPQTPDAAAVISRIEIERPEETKVERLPTPAEEQKLLAIANREFSTLYRFVRETGADFNQLASLDVPDVDLSSDWLELKPGAIRGRNVLRRKGRPRRFGIPGCELTPERRVLLETAIGDRTSGPVFLSPRGKRWTHKGACSAFTRLRAAAGVDPVVQFMGQTRLHTRRPHIDRTRDRTFLRKPLST